MFEEKAIISSFLRKYKIKSVDKREDVKILTQLILRPDDGGIRVQIEKRNESIK